MGCNCGKSKKNTKLANKINNIMAKKKRKPAGPPVYYRVKKSASENINYFRKSGGQKIYLEGITQEQLKLLYENGFNEIEIVEVKKITKDEIKENEQ
jgi:hypothetical protein